MADFTPTQKPSDERNLPSVLIDVPAKSLKELDGLEPGKAVRVVLEGDVTEVSQREPDIMMGFSGTLRLEVRRMNVRPIDNAFSDLADDE